MSLYVFGYRDDRPFAKMPKLHIGLGELGYAVYDQGRKIDHKTVEVHRHLKQITVSVPLELLGKPQRILTSARTYLGEVPLDWVSWRVLKLSSARDAPQL